MSDRIPVTGKFDFNEDGTLVLHVGPYKLDMVPETVERLRQELNNRSDDERYTTVDEDDEEEYCDESFEPGDVVMLVSGGPLMTVNCYDDETDEVECVFADCNGEPSGFKYNAACLIHIDMDADESWDKWASWAVS